MHGEIKGMLGEGKTPAQVVNYYVGKYGEKVLSAPAKQGFNWSAYITPFAAILVAGAAIFLVLRQWVFKSRRTPGPGLEPGLVVQPVGVVTEGGATVDALRAQLQRDLDSYGE